MILYVVLGGIDYEGDELLGVFTTEALALQHFEKTPLDINPYCWDWVIVVKVIANEPLDAFHSDDKIIAKKSTS